MHVCKAGAKSEETRALRSRILEEKTEDSHYKLISPLATQELVHIIEERESTSDVLHSTHSVAFYDYRVKMYSIVQEYSVAIDAACIVPGEERAEGLFVVDMVGDDHEGRSMHRYGRWGRGIRTNVTV